MLTKLLLIVIAEPIGYGTYPLWLTVSATPETSFIWKCLLNIMEALTTESYILLLKVCFLLKEKVTEEFQVWPAENC